MSNQKTARLYRMVMEKHICPYGLKSKFLLEREGFAVDDHHLTTREETDAFKDKHEVKTTPQTFVDGKRIGGYDALRVYFGKDKPEEERSDTSYQPVIALFAMTFLMALGAAFVATGAWFSVRTVEWFVAFSMCGLAYLKLRDIESFSTMFLNYDLLIGTIGAVSVFYAVYIQKRELKCACVGGDSNVPLGFISLTENLFMIGMGLWMGYKLLSA